MSSVRLVSYVLDPFTDERIPVAALVGDASGVQVVRAPSLDLPSRARANVERVLRDLEAEPSLDGLPLGTGPQVVAGDVHVVPVPTAAAPAWVRETLLSRIR